MKNKNIIKYGLVVATLFLVCFASIAKADVSLKTQSPSPNTVIVMLEDGWLDQYQNAVPVLEQYGFKASLDVYTMGLDTGSSKGYIDWNQLQTLYQNGYDIGSHTIHHYSLNQLSNKTLYNEVGYSKEVFLIHGIQVGEIALPYDQGQDNATVTKAVKDGGFLMMRSNNVVMNMVNNTKLPVQIFFMNNKTTVDFLNTNLNGTTTILLYHHISNDTKDSTAVSPQAFSQQMALLKANGYNVETFSQAFFNTTPIEGPLPTPTPFPLFSDMNSIGLVVIGIVAVAVVAILVITIIKRRQNK